VKHKHFPELHFATFARDLVGGVIVGERLLELERDAFAHHADCIDGVNKRFGVRAQKVPFRFMDHR
jgi:hypothetical protein